MTRLMLVAAAAAAIVAGVAGCQADNRNIERKLDEMAKDIKDLKAQVGRGGAGAAAPRPQRVEPDRQKMYSMPVDGDPFDGPADAKVTLVKAYDYACPYCEKVRPTMEDLRKKYGNDLRVVYKQLVVHPRNAMAGALALCAASKQGKHKDMDRLIWDKGFNVRQMDMSDVAPAEGGGQPQKCWDLPDGCKNVVSYAQELQLDVNKFKADMKECQGSVNKDMKDLQALLVSSTPAFFVNGRYISGAVPIENFVAVIDEELKKANEKVSQGTPAAAYYQTWVVEKGLKTVEMPK